MKMTMEQRVALWDAINDYVISCGGDVSDQTVTVPRMTAVAQVESVIQSIHPTEERTRSEEHSQ